MVARVCVCVYCVDHFGFTVICMNQKVAVSCVVHRHILAFKHTTQQMATFHPKIDKPKPSEPQNNSILIIHTFTCT